MSGKYQDNDDDIQINDNLNIIDFNQNNDVEDKQQIEVNIIVEDSDNQQDQVDIVIQEQQLDCELQESKESRTINLVKSENSNKYQNSNLHFNQIEEFLDKQYEGDFSDDQIDIQLDKQRRNSATNENLLKNQNDLIGEENSDKDFASDDENQLQTSVSPQKNIKKDNKQKDFQFNEDNFQKKLKQNKMKNQQLFQSNLKSKLHKIKGENNKEKEEKKVEIEIELQEKEDEQSEQNEESEDEWKGVNRVTLQQIEKRVDVKADEEQVIEEFEYIKWERVQQEMIKKHKISEKTEANLSLFKPSFIERVLGCLKINKSNTLQPKAYLLSFSQIKSLSLDIQNQLLFSIYLGLTQESSPPGRVGLHWISIGFQNIEPMTDTRGPGILGLIQILYLIQSHPIYIRSMLQHSQKSASQFPLCATLINVTLFLLSLLHSQSITDLLQTSCPMTVFNQLFCAFCITLLNRYKQEQGNIRQLPKVLQEVSSMFKQEVKREQKEYLYKRMDIQ